MFIADKMMRGPTRLREIAAVYLANNMPAAIDIAREQYDLDENTLPYPMKYNTSDPNEAEVFPYIGSYLTGGSDIGRTGVVNGSGSLEYHTTFEMTFFIAARTAYLGTDPAGMDIWETPGRESALRIRDDLMAIMQNLLLVSPSLGTRGQDHSVLILDNTMRLAFQDPITVNTYGSWSAAGLITANVRVYEDTVVPYLGVVATTHVDVEKVRVDQDLVITP